MIDFGVGETMIESQAHFDQHSEHFSFGIEFFVFVADEIAELGDRVESPVRNGLFDNAPQEST